MPGLQSWNVRHTYRTHFQSHIFLASSLFLSSFLSPVLICSISISLLPSLAPLSLSLSPSLPACGVAHQALEEIDPKGETILIQGPPFSRLLYLH